MMRLTIDRRYAFAGGMIGELSLNGIFLCYTLEAPRLWRPSEIDFMPPGRYHGYLRPEKADGWRIRLNDVPHHAAVQLHLGSNQNEKISSILVGTYYSSNLVANADAACARLRHAFYGSATPQYTPNLAVTLEFNGVLSAPWQDYSEASLPLVL